MATGRTVSKWLRVYLGGYDMSGYTRGIGPLATEFEEVELTVVADAIKGYLPGQASLKVGTLSGIFDNTATSGLHVIASSAGVKRVVTTAVGIRAAPAQGDPVFTGEWLQAGYQGGVDGSVVIASVPFSEWATDSTSLIYPKSWGTLLHAKGAETAANSATGVDDYGASTASGGFMTYHVISGDGTATLKVQHASANNDGSFADLGGCTSGSLDCTSVQSGLVVTTARTTTVNRYLRWQVALGTATTVTFVLSFVRMTF